MKRHDFLNAVCAVAVAVPNTRIISATPNEIGGVGIPDTALAHEATQIARSVLPVEIFNHSLRTFLFAELIGKATQVQHDAEAVYVASILHDTGMSAQCMSDENPFEVDGANLARTLLGKYGTEQRRQDLIWDAIALHDNGGIARRKQTEVALVNAGVSADFGSYLEKLSRADIVQVLSAAPRTNFVNVFVDAVAAVARRKPNASAHSFVADVGYRIVPGFSLPNFYDDVMKDDPFARY